jgi:hypothetical protein
MAVKRRRKNFLELLLCGDTYQSQARDAQRRVGIQRRRRAKGSVVAGLIGRSGSPNHRSVWRARAMSQQAVRSVSLGHGNHTDKGTRGREHEGHESRAD